MKKAFITGIYGFAGQHLAKELIKNNYEVSGIDVFYDTDIEELKITSKKTGYSLCDIRDKAKLNDIISTRRPDYVFHLAGLIKAEPNLIREINFEGTKNLLDSIVESKINPRILLIGTAYEYGIPKELPIKETHPLNPTGAYAVLKLEAEKLNHNLDIVYTRSFNHTGPGQITGTVCSDIAKQIAEIESEKKEPIISIGNMDAQRDFTDVGDVVKAYRLLAEKGKTKEAYNVCSGKAYSVKEILGIFLKLSKKDIKIERDEARMRKSDIPILIGDYSKIKNLCGWQPKIEIEKTLEDLLNYWREAI